MEDIAIPLHKPIQNTPQWLWGFLFSLYQRGCFLTFSDHGIEPDNHFGRKNNPIAWNFVLSWNHGNEHDCIKSVEYFRQCFLWRVFMSLTNVKPYRWDLGFLIGSTPSYIVLQRQVKCEDSEEGEKIVKWMGNKVQLTWIEHCANLLPVLQLRHSWCYWLSIWEMACVYVLSVGGGANCNTNHKSSLLPCVPTTFFLHLTLSLSQFLVVHATIVSHCQVSLTYAVH